MTKEDKPETLVPDSDPVAPEGADQETLPDSEVDASELADDESSATPSAAEGIQQALQDLLEFADLELDSEITRPDDRWEIELWGEDQEALLKDHGKILLAIQHLLPRLQRGLTGDSSFVRVDCDGFHEMRAERLADIAAREAHLVEKHQKARTLPPMPPDERRLVHISLRDDSAVVTESLGEGYFKRITIRPVMRRPRGF
jgi:spoIIIJ-associated protein